MLSTILRVKTILLILLGYGIQLISQNHYQVYFFLLEDCKITQAYIPEIKKLHAQFESDSVEFKAYFPNPSSDENSVKTFFDEYQPGITCVKDDNQMMAKKFDIMVMPEVIVYYQNTDKVLYQGRIDNWFAGLGKRRAKATKHELRDCLIKIQKAEAIKSQKTDAIGCYLTRL